MRVLVVNISAYKALTLFLSFFRSLHLFIQAVCGFRPFCLGKPSPNTHRAPTKEHGTRHRRRKNKQTHRHAKKNPFIYIPSSSGAKYQHTQSQRNYHKFLFLSDAFHIKFYFFGSRPLSLAPIRSLCILV